VEDLRFWHYSKPAYIFDWQYLITKKRKRKLIFTRALVSYAFFLSSNRPTMAIAMIIAITPAAIYIIRSVVVAIFD
jgi:hypothetical protein